MQRFLVVLNITLLGVGTTGGQLVSRLYYAKGGSRKWLSAWLQTGGWPLALIPLAASYAGRRARDGAGARVVLAPPRVLLAAAALGLLLGADDFLYAYGLAFLPLSTSALLFSTQLVFTVLFALAIVRQRLTAPTANAVVLLTVGAVVLGLHVSSDRPPGVTKAQYWLGFALTLGAALLYGPYLPLCCMCLYYMVLVSSAVLWRVCSLGLVGVVFGVHTLLAGILLAVFIPVTEVAAVIFLHEKFSSENGVSVVLALWGLASYSYDEWSEAKAKKKEEMTTAVAHAL
ncbi:hypothetical protein EJB05_34148, partial [Eragrostis curvula]